MPKGVYPRTANQLRAAQTNLAKGHLPESRAKAQKAMRAHVDKDPEGFSERVSASVLQVMHVPSIREKHLQGLTKAREVHGTNFRGGNGQAPIDVLPETVELLLACGFQREYPI